MITFKNLGSSPVSVRDLGIYLEGGEELDLEELYTDKQLLDSADLELAMQVENVFVYIDSNSANHEDVLEYVTKLTEFKHKRLDTLMHNVDEDAHFEVEKDVNNKTKTITYFSDSTKSVKIREEEIIRNAEGRVATLITRQYDESGTVVSSNTQQLNRDTDGKVESITYGIN